MTATSATHSSLCLQTVVNTAIGRIMRVSGALSDADFEDCRQSVYLRVVRQMRVLRPEATVAEQAAFLGQAARHACIDWLRHHKRETVFAERCQRPPRDEPGVDVATLISDRVTPEDHVIARETMALVQSVLRAVSRSGSVPDAVDGGTSSRSPAVRERLQKLLADTASKYGLDLDVTALIAAAMRKGDV